jgi:hypothetical protein
MGLNPRNMQFLDEHIGFNSQTTGFQHEKQVFTQHHGGTMGIYSTQLPSKVV